MSISNIKIRRNIYIKDYKKIPYQLLTGRHIMCYSGDLICGIDTVPPEFDHTKDWFFDCDCEFGEWGKILKIDKTNKQKKK